jgi:hypothetical protein
MTLPLLSLYESLHPEAIPKIKIVLMTYPICMTERNKLTDEDVLRIHELKKMNLTNVEIGEMMGVDESTIRHHLNREKPLDRTGLNPLTLEEETKLYTLTQILDRIIAVYMFKLERVRAVELTTESSVLKALEGLREVAALKYAMAPPEDGGLGTGTMKEPEKLENLNKDDIKRTKEVPEDVQSRLADAIRKGGVGTESEEAK